MIHAICPHCGVSIPAERFRDGRVIVPEYLTCDVCGKMMELPVHTGSNNENRLHKLAELINKVDDAGMSFDDL